MRLFAAPLLWPQRLYVFFADAVLAYRALFTWLEPQVYVMLKVIQPLFEMSLFVLIAQAATGETGYAAVGNAMRLCSVSATYGIMTMMRNERYFGTLKHILATPTTKFSIFLGRGFIHTIDGLVTVTVGFVFGYLVLGLPLDRVNLGLLALAMLVTSFSMCGLGLVLGTFGLALRDVNLLLNVIYASFFVLVGVNFPVDVLPWPLPLVSRVLPLTRGLEAARALVDGTAIAGVWPLIGGELLVGLTYVAGSYALFLVMETVARRTGSLDLF